MIVIDFARSRVIHGVGEETTDPGFALWIFLKDETQASIIVRAKNKERVKEIATALMKCNVSVVNIRE